MCSSDLAEQAFEHVRIDPQQDDQNINLRPRQNERIAIGFKQREEKVALIKPGK